MITILKTLDITFSRCWYIFSAFVFLGSLVSSCTIVRPGSYFKNVTRDTIINLAPIAKEGIKVKSGDKLSITVTSLNKAEDLIFNGDFKDGQGFEVNEAGEIHYHKLGRVKVAGLTRKQIKTKLEQQLEPYLKDPVVTLNFINHHVTVLGDIGKPQLLSMPEERLSIVDVLAQSGNTNLSTELTNIKVIRDTGENQKIIKQLNLEDHSIFSSEFFYLQPNDVVVLGNNEKMYLEEQKRIRYQQASTIALQLITVGLVIYQTFFRN